MVRVEASALCGSELHAYRSAAGHPTGNPGHEAAGVIVDANGSALWKEGDRVGVSAVQGCGNVATHLCRHLHAEGASLVVTDIDAAKVRRLVDSNIIGISIWDFDGRIIEANEAFLHTVGHSRQDIVSGRLRWTERRSG